MRTDLELARSDIKALRSERDALRKALNRQLGRQLDQLTHRELITRIDELTASNQHLADANSGPGISGTLFRFPGAVEATWVRFVAS
ncbi:hypothetical protein AB0I53_07020 [Saccharopolyspora sp. NPDC050389]|uniref:hypothetical protein n=1 Tax=Saccharopolyspora sp. NPDC050389 TaxID=3155516 RepID=UPI00340D892B